MPKLSYAEILKSVEVAAGYPATAHQKDIYQAISDYKSTVNLLVAAVAGSGKTTTIMNALKFLPDFTSNIVVAFNKHIADELNRRGMPKNTVAGTLHSNCFRAYVTSLPNGTKVDIEKWKTWDIMRVVLEDYQRTLDERVEELLDLEETDPGNTRLIPDVVDPELVDAYARLKSLDDCEAPIAKMIGLLKAQCSGDANDDTMAYIVDRYGLDWNPLWNPITTEVYQRGLEMKTILDFDDQLLYSLDEGCRFPRYDNIFVDESQDLNPIQLDIIAKMAKLGSKGPSRVIFVGDAKQSIYGFRGADPQAIREIETRFKTRCLPLSVSWRCGKAIIAAAKLIVPQIEAAPNACDGEILRMHENDFYNTVKPGDYVLCRITSPLVQKCLKLLSRGRKAVVLGRDIGASLNSILKKFSADEYSNMELMDQVTYWAQLEIGRIPGKDIRSAMKIASIQDRAEALRAICIECADVQEAQDKIKDIFTDQEAGVTFCTVHKAKGLEADRIFIIRPDLMPFPHAKLPWEQDQEMNLIYVATTRAKKTLVYVDPPKKESA